MAVEFLSNTDKGVACIYWRFPNEAGVMIETRRRPNPLDCYTRYWTLKWLGPGIHDFSYSDCAYNPTSAEFTQRLSEVYDDDA